MPLPNRKGIHALYDISRLGTVYAKTPLHHVILGEEEEDDEPVVCGSVTTITAPPKGGS